MEEGENSIAVNPFFVNPEDHDKNEANEDTDEAEHTNKVFNQVSLDSQGMDTDDNDETDTNSLTVVATDANETESNEQSVVATDANETESNDQSLVATDANVAWTDVTAVSNNIAMDCKVSKPDNETCESEPHLPVICSSKVNFDEIMSDPLPSCPDKKAEPTSKITFPDSVLIDLETKAQLMQETRNMPEGDQDQSAQNDNSETLRVELFEKDYIEKKSEDENLVHMITESEESLVQKRNVQLEITEKDLVQKNLQDENVVQKTTEAEASLKSSKAEYLVRKRLEKEILVEDTKEENGVQKKIEEDNLVENTNEENSVQNRIEEENLVEETIDEEDELVQPELSEAGIPKTKDRIEDWSFEVPQSEFEVKEDHLEAIIEDSPPDEARSIENIPSSTMDARGAALEPKSKENSTDAQAAIGIFERNQCKICLTKLTSSVSLTRHMSIHTGRIQCIICEKTFLDNGELNRHRKNFHAKAPIYLCSVLGCKAVFEDKKLRILHKNEMHKTKIKAEVFAMDDIAGHVQETESSASVENLAAEPVQDIKAESIETDGVAEKMEVDPLADTNCTPNGALLAESDLPVSEGTLLAGSDTDNWIPADTDAVLKEAPGTKTSTDPTRLQFKCDDCPFTSKWKYSLRKHCTAFQHQHPYQVRSRKKWKNNKFQCAMCNFETKFKLKLIKHKRKKHIIGVKAKAAIATSRTFIATYNCLRCNNYTTDKRSYLVMHKKNKHKMEKPPYIEEGEQVLVPVLEKDKDVDEMVENSAYKCDECDYVTDKKPNLHMHRSRKHQASQSSTHKNVTYLDFEITEDCRVASSEGESVEAGEMSENDRVASSSNLIYQCHDCEFSSFSKQRVAAHASKKNHDFGERYQCSKCPRKFIIESDLIVHQQTHATEPIQDIVQLSSPTKLFVNIPKVTITNPMVVESSSRRVFRCEFCPLQVNTENQMILHKHKKHSNELGLHRQEKHFTTPVGSNNSDIMDRSLNVIHSQPKEMPKENQKLTDSSRYHCSDCPFSTKLKALLFNHTKAFSHQHSYARRKVGRPKKAVSAPTICKTNAENNPMIKKSMAESILDNDEGIQIIVEPISQDLKMLLSRKEFIIKNPSLYHCGECEYSSSISGNFKRHKLKFSGPHKYYGRGRHLKANPHKYYGRGIHLKAKKRNALEQGNGMDVAIVENEDIAISADDNAGNEANLQNFKCEKCEYSTTDLTNMAKHKLEFPGPHSGKDEYSGAKKAKHDAAKSLNKPHPTTADSEPELHHCFTTGCNYRSKWISNLRLHCRKYDHKSRGITAKSGLYCCLTDGCNYENKWHRNVLKHCRTLNHKFRNDKKDTSQENENLVSGNLIEEYMKAMEAEGDTEEVKKAVPNQGGGTDCAEVYFCQLCEYSTQDRKMLFVHMDGKLHLQKASAESDPISQKFECKSCNFASPHQSGLIIHLKRRNHKECTANDYLVSIRFVEENMKAVEKEKNEGVSDDSVYLCRPCNYTTSYRNSLFLHMDGKFHLEKVSTNCGPLSDLNECKPCDLTFQTQFVLLRHYKAKNHKERIINDYVVSTEELLEFQKSAVKDKLIQCEQCDFKTAFKITLVNHMKSHSGRETAHPAHVQPVEKERNPFNCKLCDFTTNWKSNLSQHMKINHRETLQSSKMFKCEPCGYKSNSILKLRKHNQTPEHQELIRACNNPKPFVCVICDYRSKWFNNFKMHTTSVLHQRRATKLSLSRSTETETDHVKIHKDVAIIKCEPCGYHIDSWPGLNHHIETPEHQGFLARDFNLLEPLACALCNYHTTRADNLILHTESRAHKEKVKQLSLSSSSSEAIKIVSVESVNQNHPDLETEDGTSLTEAESNKWSKHQGSVFYCNKCDFSAKYWSNFKRHLETPAHKDPGVRQVSGHQSIGHTVNSAQYRSVDSSCRQSMDSGPSMVRIEDMDDVESIKPESSRSCTKNKDQLEIQNGRRRDIQDGDAQDLQEGCFRNVQNDVSRPSNIDYADVVVVEDNETVIGNSDHMIMDEDVVLVNNSDERLERLKQDYDAIGSLLEKARSSEFVFEHVSMSKALKIMQFLDNHNIYIKQNKKADNNKN